MMMSATGTQLVLPFDLPLGSAENAALWTPRDIWVRLTQRTMSQLGEDRRIEYKRAYYPREEPIDFNDIAKYYSAYSNTPDGGVLVFGAKSDGVATGCSTVPLPQLNRLEKCHLTLCPLARPEFRRFNVIVADKTDFCISVFVPYIGRLVETNKDEAWVRYGDSIHKMSDDEKRDFRATRQELTFELEDAPAYNYPTDFNVRIIQDFCDAFRQRENRTAWSNEEVLIDRNLLRRNGTQLIARNALGASGRSPTKKLSIVKQRVRVHGRRLSWLLGWHRSVDRSVLGCVLRASGGVAERRRAGV